MFIRSESVSIIIIIDGFFKQTDPAAVGRDDRTGNRSITAGQRVRTQGRKAAAGQRPAGSSLHLSVFIGVHLWFLPGGNWLLFLNSGDALLYCLFGVFGVFGG